MSYKANLGVLIAQVRKDHPTLSCRAMYHKIEPQGSGRDRFERLCFELGYYVEKKINYRKTTDSIGVYRFDNLLAHVILTDINQAFSSDITYFEIRDRFYFITFVIDCFSRRIIGWSTSKNLTTEVTTLAALKMSIETRKGKLAKGIIFHSDGGGQYYDKGFLALTKKFGFRNSMCEYAYENGKAERINGTIKNNYLKHYQIRSYEELVKNVDRAVKLYNEQRPHKSLKYKTPREFEKRVVDLKQPNKRRTTKSFNAKA
jgi:putative transposase